MVSFKKDFYDITKSVEDDLLEASKTLRIHLEMTVDKLREFGALVDETSKSTVTQVNLSIEESAAGYSDRFSKLFDEITSGNRQAANEAMDHIKESSDSLRSMLANYLETLLGSMATFEGKISEFTDDLDTRLQQVRFPEDYFIEKLEDPLEKLKQSVSTISDEVSGVSYELKVGGNDITRALGNVSSSADNVSGIMEDVSKIISAQGEVLELSKDQVQAFLKMSQIIGDLESSVQDSAQSLQNQKTALIDFTGSVEIIARDQKSLTLSANQQSDAAEALSLHIQNLETSLTNTLQRLGQRVQVIDSFGEFSKKQSELQVQAAELNRVLTPMAKELSALMMHLKQERIRPVATNPKPVPISHPSQTKKSFWPFK